MALSNCGVLLDLHNQELTKHGDMSFPIACYADDLSRDCVPWHWHDEWEFAIASEGEPVFLVENRRIRLRTGDGIFINAKALHSVTEDSQGGGKLHSASFMPRLLGGSMESIYWQKLVSPLLSNETCCYVYLQKDNAWQREVLQRMENTWQAIAGEPDDFENEARYELSKAMHVMLQNLNMGESALSARELREAQRIRTMMEYIEEHYMDEITAEDVSACISVSSSVCLRCFRQMLDTTPMQYIKRLRLQKASGMLLNTEKNIGEIAFDSGFRDVSYFTKAFREQYGCTPGAYRQNCKQ